MRDYESQTSFINRFSSRRSNLQEIFLADRLKEACSYKRIAGYFRSSIFELVGEELALVPDIKVICNSELDIRDIYVSKEAQAVKLKEKWNEGVVNGEGLFVRERYRRLYELLTNGNIEIRVVPKDRLFLHGKAGIIELKNGEKTAFLGSVNETRRAFQINYELVWEDRTNEAIRWVEEEFDALWKEGIPLPEAVVKEIKRQADRIEIEFNECEERELPGAVFVESPLYQGGEQLQPWQRAFVTQFLEHREQYGSVRLLIADEVGLGKTLSLGASATLSAVMDDGPVLILCPASLTQQWQIELKDKLGIPSALWLSQKKAWMDPQGHIIYTQGPQGVAKCPYQIAIVSTGLITQPTQEREALLSCRFGMVILDEAHKARRKGGLGSSKGRDNNLLEFMCRVGLKTKHILLGTATPIQTDVKEIWDLMRILNAGTEHVLGKENHSRWLELENTIPLITGKSSTVDPQLAWDLMRNPLPPSFTHQLFDRIRSDLDIDAKKIFSNRSYTSLPESTRNDVEDDVNRPTNGLSFFQLHNPILCHTILRQRKDLEKKGLLPKIGVNIHPFGSYQGISFENSFALFTNHYFDQAYMAAESFTSEMRKRCPSAGFMKTLLLQRICSSFASGISTAKKLLNRESFEEDEELSEESLNNLSGITSQEKSFLQQIVDELSRTEAVDPKLKAIRYFLTEHHIEGKTWLEHGCIIFSQYYETALWLAKNLTSVLGQEEIALYAGVGKSRLYLNGVHKSVEREFIKHAVKAREIRLVIATDAACEGLNLQTLGTLINVDLPWNPSRLEQRIGRIKRFGQTRNSVDMLNLVYHETQDEKIYKVLSSRMQDRFDILGTCPDVIQDEWIENIQTFEEECNKYWSRRQRAQNAFKVRYQDNLNPDQNRWETCTKVLSRYDLVQKLSKPWK
ncbi:MAG: phospholipase D-like domain-containing anti-phage protein [Waddliaceae bacterium]